MKTMGVSLDYDGCGSLIANFVVRLTLVDQIKGKQIQDDELIKNKKVDKIMNCDIGKKF